MKHFDLSKPKTVTGLIKFIGLPGAALYVFSMLFWPFISSGLNWGYVQDVWDRWQSLNVGMLAFASSITAFSISRYNAEKQRQRDFLASKAFLPEALSELTSYFKESAVVYKAYWASERGTRPVVRSPELPSGYKAVFAECIRHAEPRVGDYLSQILVGLQVHDARLRDLVQEPRDEVYFNTDRANLITYFYRLAELQALVNKLFEFARNLEQFDDVPLAWGDFSTAYANLKIRINEIRITEHVNLEDFTKRAIARKTGDNT